MQVPLSRCWERKLAWHLGQDVLAVGVVAFVSLEENLVAVDRKHYRMTRFGGAAREAAHSAEQVYDACARRQNGCIGAEVPQGELLHRLIYTILSALFISVAARSAPALFFHIL
jgi:hypothetical protein